MLNFSCKNSLWHDLTRKAMLTALALAVIIQAWSLPDSTEAAPGILRNGRHTPAFLRMPANDITVTAAGGAITCTIPSVLLDVTTDAGAPTFSWTGPGGFTSTVKRPVATIAGSYTVTVTDLDGQTGSATAVVVLNNTRPGATITSSGVITCLQPTVTLTASAAEPAVTYRWIGPGGFISTQQTVVASVPGGYSLVVTNLANGCTSSAAASVTRNITAPVATATVSGVLTCVQHAVTLTGSSTTAGATFSWTGPGGFSSTEQNTVTTIPGTYTLLVTNPVNGCSATTTVTVMQNTAAPGNVTATVTGMLTCAQAYVTLAGSSTTPGVIYQWAGPGGFASTEQNPLTTLPGIYVLTVTSPVSGCTSTASTEVMQNITAPGATATVSDLITCTQPEVTLTGASATAGVLYTWIRPDNTSFMAQNLVTSIPGMYTLIVTDPLNACTSTAAVLVVQDITPPGATASVSGPITCETPFATLSGASDVPWATFSWTGPEGFSSTEQEVLTTIPGLYILIVTNSVNGCVAIAEVTVTSDDGDCSSLLNARAAGSADEDTGEAILYPNPVNDHGTINFKALDNGLLKLEIYNMSNIKVATLFEGEVLAGKSYAIDFEATGYKNGMYLYRITGAGISKRGRIFVSH